MGTVETLSRGLASGPSYLIWISTPFSSVSALGCGAVWGAGPVRGRGFSLYSTIWPSITIEKGIDPEPAAGVWLRALHGVVIATAISGLPEMTSVQELSSCWPSIMPSAHMSGDGQWLRLRCYLSGKRYTHI